MSNGKRCSRCGVFKPIDAFYIYPGARGRRRTRCKDCHNADLRVRQGPDRDRIMMKAIYTAESLASEAGVSHRTIRNYIVKGLVPKAYPRTCSPQHDLRYGIEHLQALREIQKLREGILTLDDIRDRLYPEDD